METRNQSFQHGEDPFHHHNDLQVQPDKINGPIWFMNPTRARYAYSGRSEATSDSEGLTQVQDDALQAEDSHRIAEASGIEYKWTSRNNRKGRHALLLRESYDGVCPYATPQATNTPKSVLSGIWRMCTIFIPWDISYVLAVTFTIACMILVANAVLTFLPYAKPGYQLPNYITRVEAILNVIGCVLFLTGSFCAFTEAVNANRKGCFGWKLEHAAYADSKDNTSVEFGDLQVLVPDGSCSHHHDARQVLSAQSTNWAFEGVDNEAVDISKQKASVADKVKAPWKWVPSAHELRTHHIYDIGFVTSCLLLTSSLLYCCASIAALVTTFTAGQVARWIRIPQLIAAVGFFVSSTLFTLETQTAWLRLEPRVLGWHLSLWNAIGSLGFILTAIFGFVESGPRAEFQFGCSCLWGSLAFLTGSVLQWYESLDKYPVEKRKKR